MSLLDIQHITVKMPGIEKPLLDDISYQIQRQDFVIILGVNGSGKTSLLKLIDRRLKITQGNILLNQKPIHQYGHRAYSHLVTTLTQNCHESLFTSLTLFENYLLVKRTHEKNDREYFKEFIHTFNPNLVDKLDHLVDKLSGGEKQALALALSVLSPPQILLLDEHTSALDPKTGEKLMQKTAEVVIAHGITCILATHDLALASQYGNRILALRQGKIYKTFESDEKNTLKQTDLLAACY